MIRDLSEMWSDELEAAWFPIYAERVGRGSWRWLRQCARGATPLAPIARAELSRRARMEDES